MPSSFTVSISPTSGSGNRSFNVTITSVDGFFGTVNLTSSMNPAGTSGVSPPSVTLAPGGSATATCTAGNVIHDSTLTVTGTSGSLSASATAGISAGSFTVSLSPTSGHGNANYTVTVTSVNNFAGTVNLTSSINPAATCGVSPTSVIVPAGGSASSNLTVGNVIQASTLTVTGSYSQGGVTITASATASISAGSFTVSLNPTSGPGSSNYTVTVTSVNHFGGTVNVTCSLNPTATCGASPTSVTLSPGGSGSTMCMVGNVIQASTLTVTGSFTHGGVTITASATASISAGSFTVSVSPGSGAGPFNVTVTSGNNFAGTVNLTSAMSNGAGCTVSPPSVTLGSGGSGSATCTVGAGPATLTVTGSYTQGGITITANGVSNVT